MYIHLFLGKYDLDITNKLDKLNLCYLNNNKIIIDKIIVDYWNYTDPNYLVNLIFPNHNVCISSSIGTNSNSSSNTNTNTHTNIWNNFSYRPFKICPINKEKLYLVSNNSIINICIFDQEYTNKLSNTNKLVGFVVVSNKFDCYWIEIFCTNIRQGIGSILDQLLKTILIDKPIRLICTFNSIQFYLKKGFTVISKEFNLLEFNNAN